MTQSDSTGMQEASYEEPAQRTLTSAEMAIVRAGWAVLSTIGVAAIAIAMLAFQPWVDFGSIDAKGTDMKALTGESDGYFVAGLAVVILLSAAGVLSRPKWTLALLPLMALSAIVIFTTAVYSIFTDWHVAGADGDGAFIIGGDPTVVPYLIAGLAVAIALMASVLAALRASRTR